MYQSPNVLKQHLDHYSICYHGSVNSQPTHVYSGRLRKGAKILKNGILYYVPQYLVHGLLVTGQEQQEIQGTNLSCLMSLEYKTFCSYCVDMKFLKDCLYQNIPSRQELFKSTEAAV